jgi:hypothetical protein
MLNRGIDCKLLKDSKINIELTGTDLIAIVDGLGMLLSLENIPLCEDCVESTEGLLKMIASILDKEADKKNAWLKEDDYDEPEEEGEIVL